MSKTTQQRIRQLGFEFLPKRFQTSARETIYITLHRAKREIDIPIGASKIGGQPDLPQGWKWPINESKRKGHSSVGQPLAFFFQLNLAESSKYDLEHKLPKAGWLYFFIAATLFDHSDGDNKSWRLLYFPGNASKLSRREPPSIPSQQKLEDASSNVKLHPCQISFYREIQFHYDVASFCEDQMAAELYGDKDAAKEARLLQKQMDGWKANRNGKEKTICIDTGRPNGEPAHQLFGHPNFGGCEEPNGYILLAKIDDDGKNTKMSFVDAGSWFIYIRESDLKAKRFDNVRVRFTFG